MDKDTGLINKYSVHRTDGRDAPGGDKDGASYFVLDYVHDPIARAALEYYSELARAEDYEALANDLNDAISVVVEAAQRSPVTHGLVSFATHTLLRLRHESRERSRLNSEDRNRVDHVMLRLNDLIDTLASGSVPTGGLREVVESVFELASVIQGGVLR